MPKLEDITDPTKFAICEPGINANVSILFHRSFIGLQKPAFTYFAPMFTAGDFASSISDVRNNLVEQVLDKGCEWMLWIDTDQVYYDPNMIAKMMAHDKDVVTARVHKRWPPFDHLLLRSEDPNSIAEPGTNHKYNLISDEEASSGKLIEIDATGVCACSLMKVDVFIDMLYPWFETFKPGDGIERTIGEDINLCAKLKSAGYKIYADTSIEVKHLTTLQVDYTYYKSFQFLNEVGSHEKKLNMEKGNGIE